MVNLPLSRNQLPNVVPGALEVYDLPDLAALVRLNIKDPVDAAGNPLAPEEVERFYERVKRARAAQNEKKK